jgi:hypothetical protein
MVDSNPTATSNPATVPPAAMPSAAGPPAAGPEVYRPLSALAIAGLALAAIYVALVAIVAGVAFFQATPVFLPAWTLLLAIAAAALSLLGQWHIRESEGTRAGLALARWGLGLSIFAGLGYAAYQYFTGLALVQQANNFLTVTSDADSGFFSRLQTGDPTEINHAFLLTLPENIRSNIDPRDMEKMEKAFNRAGGKDAEGHLSKFRNHLLVRSLTQNGKNAKIEVLGVQNWAFEKGSYLVSRDYRLIAPEIIVDFAAAVQSTEGDQRKWFLAFPKIDFKKAEMTPLGTALLNAGAAARAFVNQHGMEASLNESTDKTNWSAVVQDQPWKPIRDHIAKLLRGGAQSLHNMHSPPPQLQERGGPPWQVLGQRLRFTLDFQYRFKGPDGPWMGSGQVVVEDQKPLTMDSRNLPDPQSIAREPDWKIIAIDFKQLNDMERMMKKMKEMKGR